MASKQITIRDGVFTKITADSSGYVITTANLTITKTFYPQRNLEELDDSTYIYVISKSPGVFLEGQVRAPKAIIFELEVRVELLKRLQPSETDFESDLEDLTELYEQLLTTCMDHDLVTVLSTAPRYLFQKIEPEMDDNGQVYSHEQLTEENVFHAIFTASYQLQQQPT